MPVHNVLYLVLVPLLAAFGTPHGPCTVTPRTALCKNYQLLSVPSHLPQETEELFLDQNLVRKLQNGCLSWYPFLRLLSCTNCQLREVEDLAFSSSPLIKTLNLANNELHNGHKQFGQSLSFLTTLRSLDLSSNGFTEDMVSELLQNITSLEFLDLSRNSLLRLDESTFRDLHQLKELNLERNILFEIEGAFDNLKTLTRLNLAFNSLPCLVKFEMTHLLLLNASHNLIEWFITNPDLPETFELETLDLSDNQLLYFPILPTHSHIKTLLLSNNHISFYGHLSQDTSPNWTTSVEFYNLGGNTSNVTAELWNDNIHGDISSVELLDLSVNQVRYFPQGFLQKMPNLYWLRLRSNCLESLNLTAEDLPVTLYELDVSNNRITELKAQPSSVNKLNNLTHLNMSLNNIQKLPSRVFTTLHSLTIVDLSYNSLGLCHPSDFGNPDSTLCVVWTNLSSLKQLHIAGCNIIHLPPLVFEGTPLTHLDLSNNPDLLIDQDYSLGVSGTLQQLGLSNTGLKDFNFSPYKHLTFLNISKNFISELPTSLSTLNLKLLDLRDNMLTTIGTEHVNELAKHVQTIYLSGNSFNCCHLEWYKTFEQTMTLRIADLSEITCMDLHLQRQNARLFNSIICGESSLDDALFWYIVLFVSVGVSVVGISVIFILTFRPKLLPLVIKKKCWRPTTY